MPSLTHDLRALFAPFGETAVPADNTRSGGCRHTVIRALVNPVHKTLRAPGHGARTPGAGTIAGTVPLPTARPGLCTQVLKRGPASRAVQSLVFPHEESVRAGGPSCRRTWRAWVAALPACRVPGGPSVCCLSEMFVSLLIPDTEPRPRSFSGRVPGILRQVRGFFCRQQGARGLGRRL